jgi:hypothetical protein
MILPFSDGSSKNLRYPASMVDLGVKLLSAISALSSTPVSGMYQPVYSEGVAHELWNISSRHHSRTYRVDGDIVSLLSVNFGILRDLPQYEPTSEWERLHAQIQ